MEKDCKHKTINIVFGFDIFDNINILGLYLLFLQL